MKSTQIGVSQEILYDSRYKSVPVTVASEQVTATDGRKVLKAGTFIKAETGSIFDDRSQRVVETAGTSGAIDGILLYDVDVTDGDAVGACVYNGTVWANKVGTGNITANMRTQLPQVTFVQG